MFFFFQAEDGIRDDLVTGVQTCALPIYPTDPVIDEAAFEARDWTSSEFGHIDGREALPDKLPEPRGRGFIIKAKGDADRKSVV